MNFKNNKNLILICARGSISSLLDQIQFKFLNIYTGRIIWTPTCVSGSENNVWSFEAPPDSWVTNIWLKTSQYVDQLKFGLNRGRESEYFGGTEGSELHHQNFVGKMIYGVVCYDQSTPMLFNSMEWTTIHYHVEDD